MSFKKFQIINPDAIGSPEPGHIYLGRDNIGLWEKYPDGDWVYIVTGGTTGAGTSGTSGAAGSSGKDGSFLGSSGVSGSSGISSSSGVSGSSGRSGTDGTAGTSGYTGSSGTSGTSGKTGTAGSSGTSGTTGSSGSSGKDGNFWGSSGTSATSGISGGYGGASRKWRFTTSTYPVTPGYFYAYGTTYNLNDITYIRINEQDGDSQGVNNWLSSWTNGILKIEEWGNPQNFGLYSIVSGVTTNIFVVSYYEISGITAYSADGVLTNGVDYLISYVPGSGTSGGGSGKNGSVTSGITVSTGYTTTTSDYYIRVIASGMTITLHDATQSYQELIIKNASNGNINVQRQNSNTMDGLTTKTLLTLQCLIVKDGAINSWDIISFY